MVPAVAGLFFYWAVKAAGVDDDQVWYYALVVTAYLVTLAVNFVIAAGYASYIASLVAGSGRGQDVGPDAPGRAGVRSDDRRRRVRHRSGGHRRPAAVRDRAGGTSYLVSELLTSKRRSEELQRIATTDELTGLANRERFNDAIDERIARRHGRRRPLRACC